MPPVTGDVPTLKYIISYKLMWNLALASNANRTLR